MTSRRLLAVLAVLGALVALGWLLSERPSTDEPTPLGGDGPTAQDDGRGPLLESDDVLVLTDEERAARDQELDARVASAAFLTGRVVDPTKRGIPDAVVKVLPIDIRSLRGAPYDDGDPVGEGRTDRDGAFRLDVTARGWLRVVASAPGRATVGRRIAGPGVDVELVLPTAAGLDIEVVDAEGRAVADADVDVRVEYTRARGTTDGKGIASFDTLPPGSARVRAGREDRGSVIAGPYVVRSGERTRAIVLLPDGVQIAGTVVDHETDSPIAGAVVHIAHPGRSTASEPTAADGRFGPLPGGGVAERVFLAAAAPGYAPTLIPVVLGNRDAVDFPIRMQAAPPWRGRVVDGRGQAVAGATVAYTTDGIAGRDPASTTTDAQGAFELPPPPPPAPGRRVVLFAKHGTASAALALRPGSTKPEPLELRLTEGRVLRGQVVDASGAPRPGVEVRITSVRDALRDWHDPGAATSLVLLANETQFATLAGASDAQGRWVIGGVPAGPYQLRYRWDGGQLRSPDVVQVEDAQVDVGRVTLGDGGTLSGRITDRTGAPAAGVELRLAPSGNGFQAQRLTSDAEGWFEFGGLAAGEHTLSATWGNVPRLVEKIELVEGDDQRLDLRFDAGATLTGTVTTPSGAPFQGILRVSLRQEGSERAARTPYGVRVTGGRLEVEDVTPGRWLVEVSAGDLHGTGGPVDIAAERNATVQITLAKQLRLMGRAVTSSGRGSPGATISLQHAETGRFLLVTADANGAFTLEGMPAGRWDAVVEGPGGARTRSDVEIRASGDTRVTLTMDASGDARITVRDAKGRPVPQALLRFRRPDGSLATRRPIRTDARGEADVRDLPIERLIVLAGTLDGRRGIGEVYIVEGKSTDLTIEVRPREGG